MGRKKRSAEEDARTVPSESDEPKKRRTRRVKENPELGNEPSVETPEDTRVEPKPRTRRSRKDLENNSSGNGENETPVSASTDDRRKRASGSTRRGRTPAERDTRGDIVPAGSAVCCICGSVSKQRSQSLQRVDLRFSIGTRELKLVNKWMCMECVKQLPNFIAGALHFAFNIPKDQFLRGFLYPPLELALNDQHKPLK